MPIYLTLDLEVNNHKLNKRLAGPFDERNYVVESGWSVNGGPKSWQYYPEWHRDPVLPDVIDEMGAGDYVITFNGKFDMLWCWDDPRLQAAFKRGLRMWDGQFTEYMLEGMVKEAQMLSMNDLAERYGGGVKIDAVKEMWEAGTLTKDVPEDLLTEYLVGSTPDKACHECPHGDENHVTGDIDNTWLIFVGQAKRVKTEMAPQFGTMLKERHDAILCSTEMEYNGMLVKQELAEVLRQETSDELDAAKVELEEFVPELPKELLYNWGSSQHKSALIFGGTVKYLKWEQYKDANGSLEWANKTVQYPIFTYLGVPRPVPPERCVKAGELYVLEVPASMLHEDGSTGPVPSAFMHPKTEKWYLAQDVFKSGKRMGEGKTKNMVADDHDKPKGKQNEKYFTFKGYTKPDPRWAGDSTDACGEPFYSTSADTLETLSKRGLPFTDALGAHTKLAKDLGTYYWAEDKKGVRKGMLTIVGEDGIIHHSLNHVKTVTSRMSSSDPRLKLGSLNFVNSGERLAA